MLLAPFSKCSQGNLGVNQQQHCLRVAAVSVGPATGSQGQGTIAALFIQQPLEISKTPNENDQQDENSPGGLVREGQVEVRQTRRPCRLQRTEGS